MAQLHLVVGLLLAVATSLCQAQTRTSYWLDSCPAATTDAGWPVYQLPNAFLSGIRGR